MRKKKENYLKKGEYTHPQTSGFLSVKQYILMEQEGKHCLLLKFENEMDLVITEAAITVTQLDEKKKQLGNIDIRYEDINIKKKRAFFPENAIVVDDACFDCIVNVRYVICNNIKYEVRGGYVVGNYDKRACESPSTELDVKNKHHKVRRRSFSRRFYYFIAFISLLLVVISLVFFKVLFDINSQTEESHDPYQYSDT